MVKLAFDINRVARFDDPCEMPSYTVAEAAHYLSIPPKTIKNWVVGYDYKTNKGKQRFQPVINLTDKSTLLLSFYNLAEAHVLRGLRTNDKIPLQHIRRALDYVCRKYGWKRPLIQEEFRTDGVSLFVEKLGTLVDASATGQLIMPDVVKAHLKRIDWEDDLAVRLYPFTRLNAYLESPRLIVIDPRLSYGRPIVKSMGVTTATLAERYKAGDSMEKLSRDYGGSKRDIEEALRCELQIGTAA